MEVMEYLTTRSWHWTHGHLDLVRSHMSPEDQKVCGGVGVVCGGVGVVCGGVGVVCGGVGESVVGLGWG